MVGRRPARGDGCSKTARTAGASSRGPRSSCERGRRGRGGDGRTGSSARRVAGQFRSGRGPAAGTARGSRAAPSTRACGPRASRSGRRASRSRGSPAAPAARSAGAGRSRRRAAPARAPRTAAEAGRARARRRRRGRRGRRRGARPSAGLRERNRPDLLDAGDAVRIGRLLLEHAEAEARLEEDVVAAVRRALRIRRSPRPSRSRGSAGASSRGLDAGLQHRHADRPVARERVGHHRAVPGLEDVEGQQRPGQQHDVREREERDAPAHRAGAPVATRAAGASPLPGERVDVGDDLADLLVGQLALELRHRIVPERGSAARSPRGSRRSATRRRSGSRREVAGHDRLAVAVGVVAGRALALEDAPARGRRRGPRSRPRARAARRQAASAARGRARGERAGARGAV